MAPPPRPKNCAPSWRNPSPSGNSPTPLCSCRKSREPAWANSKRPPCASSSPIITGSLSRNGRAPKFRMWDDSVVELLSQQGFPAGPGVRARFLVGLGAAGVFAGAHEAVTRAIVGDRLVLLACRFHLLD